MALTPQTRYVRARDGVNLAMQQFGAGPDIVVLTGGFSHVELRWEDPLLARSWRRVASFARVTAFDQRGGGLSDRVAAPASLETRVSDVLDILDAAEVSTAFVHGSTEGGCVALALAAQHADVVQALVLESTAAKAVATTDYPGGIPSAVWSAMLELVDASSFEELVELVAPSRAAEPAFRSWFARWVRYGSGPGGLGALLRWIESVDVRALLGRVRCPVTVVHSRTDPLIPVSAARFIADGVADGRLVEVEGDTGWFSPNADINLDVLEDVVTGTVRSFEDRLRCTVVFFDLVGSTAHAARLGDRDWRVLLDRHDRAVQDGVLAAGGQVVKSTGDGALALFESAPAAVLAAHQIVASVEQLGLQSRVGIHVGEIERRGLDVAGVDVHVASRVAAAAGPSQVLVSAPVAAALETGAVRWAGNYQLRGLMEIWELFEAV